MALRFDEGERGKTAPRQTSGRGVSYWTDGTEERILFHTPALGTFRFTKPPQQLGAGRGRRFVLGEGGPRSHPARNQNVICIDARAPQS